MVLLAYKCISVHYRAKSSLSIASSSHLKFVTFFARFERIDNVFEGSVAVKLGLEAEPLLGLLTRRYINVLIVWRARVCGQTLF